MRIRREFNSLPKEILPLILSHIRPSIGDLARCCRVCRSWSEAATPVLYERIVLRNAVFSSLAASPELCQHLSVLELRAWPFSWPRERQLSLEERVRWCLSHASRLTRLIWTRRDSLSTDSLLTICGLKSLNELEINGTTNSLISSYKPERLLELPPLKSFTIHSPDINVIKYLLELCQNNWAFGFAEPFRGCSLQKLSLVGNHSNSFRDLDLQLLQSCLAPHLISLSLIGFSKITVEGLRSLFKEFSNLQHLTLESLVLPPTFFRLLDYQSSGVDSLLKKGSLTRLISFTITYTNHEQIDATETFFDGLANFVNHCPSLRALTVYPSRSVKLAQIRTHESPRLPSAFLDQILADPYSTSGSLLGERLTKLAVHAIDLTLNLLCQLCSSASRLEDLAVHLCEDDLPRTGSYLALLPELRTLHIGSRFISYDADNALFLATRCRGHLNQIGLQHSAWSIIRTPLFPVNQLAWKLPSTQFTYLKQSLDRISSIYISLIPYDGTIWPEFALVVYE
ncbi:hypothetical protein CROQUDRAFT_88309 [Cronartium quercuum f. sp. fusiforme G11]|uniref:F-box domain-containing protein n=1 Tax=Cronartium quercuum f. sp. fusiforme G11 TaxID=708437 RepID=A0A9P6NTJ8_9BASI|nr:hypothetical protein CROQUDRAFT_88309 [Cronartium quercuum f. sp. fusiforme G11]